MWAAHLFTAVVRAFMAVISVSGIDTYNDDFAEARAAVVSGSAGTTPAREAKLTTMAVQYC